MLQCESCPLPAGGRSFSFRETIRLIVSFQSQKNIKVKPELLETCDKNAAMSFHCIVLNQHFSN